MPGKTRLLDRREKFRLVEGFSNKIESTVFQRADRALDRRECRNHHDRNLRLVSTHGRENVHTADARHVEVRNHRIELFAPDRFDRFFFICLSPKGPLVAPPDRDDVYVWSGVELAAAILRTGMSDWILEKAA